MNKLDKNSIVGLIIFYIVVTIPLAAAWAIYSCTAWPQVSVDTLAKATILTYMLTGFVTLMIIISNKDDEKEEKSQ